MPELVDSRRALAVTAFLLLLVFAFATRDSALLLVYMMAAIALAGIGILGTERPTRREMNAAVVLIGAMLLILPFSVFRSETAILHYLGTLVSLSAAFVLTRDLRVYLLASQASVVLVQGLVVAYLLQVGLEDFPLEDMVPNSSSNGVTSYLILLQVNYCVLRFLLDRKSCVLTSLVTLVICFVGYGRASLVAAVLILGANLLAVAWTVRRGRSARIVLSLVVVSVGWLPFADEMAGFIEDRTKIGAGFEDEARTAIIDDYLGRIDPLSFMFGADYDGTSIEREYNNNPHNSFIRAHHFFGLPYLAALLAFPLILFRRTHPVSVKLFSAVMLFVVLARAFTEPILFPTLLDFYYFAMCFALGRNPQPALARPGH